MSCTLNWTVWILPGISRWQWFEDIIEIYNNFIQWKEEFHHDTLVINVNHILLDRPAILKEEKQSVRCWFPSITFHYFFMKNKHRTFFFFFSFFSISLCFLFGSRPVWKHWISSQTFSAFESQYKSCKDSWAQMLLSDHQTRGMTLSSGLMCHLQT